MHLRKIRTTFAILVVAVWANLGTAEVTIAGVEEIAPVWSGHTVGFSLLTAPPHQYVAFYDEDRNMTVGTRTLDSDQGWSFVVLPERVGWDSHNSITMTIDDDGRLHLSGNMHVDPLVYFRTRVPHDIASFERVDAMVGTEESRSTYPQFFRGPANELIFTYRDGHSGAGNQIYNVYDHDTRTWSRLLDTPLVDGEGKKNAYFAGPQRGPDGYYHLCWVWREHGGCETNHNLSYARSRDLRHWENSRGKALTLPITFATGEVVDPVPIGGGIINGNARIGFDEDKRVVLTYHKYDEAGNTQIYNARLGENGWTIHQSSDFDYRWGFKGGGSIHFEIRVNPIQTTADGVITQTTVHDKLGTQRWRLDPETLAPIEKLPLPPSSIPPALGAVESSFPGMGVRYASDLGHSGVAGTRYLMRWETLGQHRDQPREKPWPDPTMLRIYRLKQTEQAD